LVRKLLQSAKLETDDITVIVTGYGL